MPSKRYKRNLNETVKSFEQRHQHHIEDLKNLGKQLNHYLLQYIEQLWLQFNKEAQIIALLKRMRKSFGQLKYRLWIWNARKWWHPRSI